MMVDASGNLAPLGDVEIFCRRKPQLFEACFETAEEILDGLLCSFGGIWHTVIAIGEGEEDITLGEIAMNEIVEAILTILFIQSHHGFGGRLGFASSAALC